MKLMPYLNFVSTLDALEFYKSLGAEVKELRLGDEAMFQDMPDYAMPKEVAERFVMYCRFEILGNSISASDAWGGRPVDHSNSSLVFDIDGKNEMDLLEAKAFFAKAVELGCEVEMPLGAVEWSPLFGMFRDPFGITWMFNASNVD